MKMELTPEDHELIKTIISYHSLPGKEQERLRPLLEDTIARHRVLGRMSKFFKEYFSVREDVNDFDQCCVWKRVADEDLEMRARGERRTPFFSGSDCYECNGYKAECDKYLGFYLKRKCEKR